MPVSEISETVDASNTPPKGRAFFVILFLLVTAALVFFSEQQFKLLANQPQPILMRLGFGIQILAFIPVIWAFSGVVKWYKSELAAAAEMENRLNERLAFSAAKLADTQAQFEYYSVQLEFTAAELQASKRETDLIFTAVKQGLFLLGPGGIINSQTSGELVNIFQTNDFAFRSFYHLLRPLLPEKKHQTVADYVNLLFDPRKNEKQLQKFNPLKRAELSFATPSGGFQTKTVEFSFQRITVEGVVDSILVTAIDSTEQALLEARLRANEEQREKQLETLLEILSLDGTYLRNFILEATVTVDEINSIFMENTDSNVREEAGNPLRSKVQRAFRLAHSLKARASSLGLSMFQRTIHKIEDHLTELRQIPNLTNEHFLSVVISLSSMRKQLDETTELIEKISSVQQNFGRTFNLNTPNSGFSGGGPNIAWSIGEGENFGTRDDLAPVMADSLKGSIELLGRLLGERSGKEADFIFTLDEFDSLSDSHRRAFRDATYQLVRNSYVHGIELPDEREQAGKNRRGVIKVVLHKDDSQIRLQVLDDGAGLNREKIISRAIDSNLLRPEEAENLKDNEICELIFETGFSTSTTVTEDAGRGMGLDAVKGEIVDRFGGEIQINFLAGAYCEFNLTVPSAQASLQNN
jgi:two-component system chemotaxis sensor kinase CheA